MNSRGSRERQDRMSQAMAHFANPDGDHMMYLSIYNEFVDNNKNRAWCDEYVLCYNALLRATEIRRHLDRYVKRFKSLDNCRMANSEEDFVSPGSSGNGDEDIARSASIRKCLVSGYFANAAKLHGDSVYRTLRDQRPVQLHPTSIYFHMGTLPDWIIFHQSVLTTEEFVREVSRIDPRWLVNLAPDFYQTKEVSGVISGNSGPLGLPLFSSTVSKNNKRKISSKENKLPQREATDADGRILFRKPKRSVQEAKPTLPVHVGKSKGGLRSQF